MTTKPTREHYSHKIADAKKNQKRIEAKERQQLRNKRSNKEQITKLDAGGYKATKERARLQS